MSGPLRVVIAEDHYLVREGVRRALERSRAIEVLDAVATPAELHAAVATLEPEVVITDIRMPPTHGTEGIEAALAIRSAHPRTGVVILSQYNDPDYAMTLFRDGTAYLAYLLKQRVGDPAQLLEAVRTVNAGGSVVDPDVVGALVSRSGRGESSPLKGLTDREFDVLSGMAEGRTNVSIADRLSLSESSIERYSTSIFAKLGLADEPDLHRRVSAVLAFLDEQGKARPLRDG
jgi:DNA-binding NarL/FixJ family response regulator